MQYKNSTKQPNNIKSIQKFGVDGIYLFWKEILPAHKGCFFLNK